jgi:hypothetical protein
MEHFSKQIRKIKTRRQPAGMPTNLLALGTVYYVDSQSDCSTMVNREPPALSCDHGHTKNRNYTLPVADVFMGHYPEAHQKTRCGQLAGISADLLFLGTVDLVDSKSDCSKMVDREPPLGRRYGLK